ncbi:hypothetical protein CROQUDRAFT_657050 [Cronartium quercuum f. sp. fusiforme G11]|uniref:Amino acid transporter transmembrane domain-containing protein n=1 Tax=Cronartium quercuum f. sp. fusiforme G11 TaxID=708437 RepID=A0A9P6NIM9_9BASI|nr:hypothetical protein CROQUDRAFT_657050 [Cronartium quercuum f. sp. fusiforme G11]
MQSPTIPEPVSPEHTPTQHAPESSSRGVFASSIDLVRGYQRSQSYLAENLSSSLNQSSLSTSYQASRDHRGDVESQWEADDEFEDGRSLSPTPEDGYDTDEGPEMSSLDGDHPRQPSGTPNLSTHSARYSVSPHASTFPTGLRKFWSQRLSANFRTPKASSSSLRAQINDPASSETGQLANPSWHPNSHAERSGLLAPSMSVRNYDSVSDSSSAQLIYTDSSSIKGLSRKRRSGHLPRHRSSSFSCDTAHQPGISDPISGTGTSTFGQTLFNSFNILCGVGLLSEPLAFSSAGWVGSALLFLFCGLVTNYTAKILARIMIQDRSLFTYNDICCKAFGRSMQYPIAGLFCLELFALSVALMVIFGDSMAIIFPGYGPTLFKLLAFCLVIPTVFMPFKILSYSSLLGLFSSLTLVGVVVFDGLVKQDAPGSIFDPVETSLWPSGKWGLSAGLMMSGFSGHSVIPSLARDMRDPQEFNRMIDWAYISAGSMYAVVGVAGYLMFGNSVSQEITHDILVTAGFPVLVNQIAIWMVAINPIAKFALCTRPLNLTIEHLFSLGTGGTVDEHGAPPRPQSNPPPTSTSSATSNGVAHQNGSQKSLASRGSKMIKPPQPSVRFTKAFGRLVARFSVTSLVVIVSIVMPDFDRVMSFLGAFAAFVICVILPVSAKLLLHNESSQLEKGTDLMLLIVSIAMAAIGTIFSFLPNQ